MELIVYKGPAHFRELNEADFAKFDHDHKDLVFARGVPQDVSNEIAKLLLEHKEFAGEFAIATPADLVAGEVQTSQPLNELNSGDTPDPADDKSKQNDEPVEPSDAHSKGKSKSKSAS